MLKGIKEGGTFLLNSIWDAEETKNHFPDEMKKAAIGMGLNATFASEVFGFTRG